MAWRVLSGRLSVCWSRAPCIAVSNPRTVTVASPAVWVTVKLSHTTNGDATGYLTKSLTTFSFSFLFLPEHILGSLASRVTPCIRHLNNHDHKRRAK
ncbi:hypothetical protein FJTKL_07521 [Diaporthe vaccinii]|uniref:Secreted protein n=1 Tax=Diaporthe vaccinii TaxID=105482 RepID=A0ABR4ETM7_9PEZI